MNLEKLFSHRAKIDLYGENQAEKEVKRLEASLLKIEKKYKIQSWDQKCEDYTQFLKQANKQQKIKLLASLKQLVVERCFLLSLVKRYAKGQAVAIRLNRQLKRVGKNMTKALNQYNGIGEHTGQLPDLLEFNDIKSSDCIISSIFC
ncbi:uncharacterized protein [Mytilus edulis]|uniref:uncharacterized protein n=1 Tax=Mytilus edulis TaxID=6550 RepID=UPI0039EED48C